MWNEDLGIRPKRHFPFHPFHTYLEKKRVGPQDMKRLACIQPSSSSTRAEPWSSVWPLGHMGGGPHGDTCVGVQKVWVDLGPLVLLRGLCIFLRGQGEKDMLCRENA